MDSLPQSQEVFLPPNVKPLYTNLTFPQERHSRIEYVFIIKLLTHSTLATPYHSKHTLFLSYFHP